MMRFGFTALNILLVAAACFFGVDLFYQIVSSRLVQASLSDLKAVSAPPRQLIGERRLEPSEESLGGAACQAIIDRDLFKTKGAAKQEKKLDAAELENLEKTQLNLTLWGTVTGIVDTPYAVIEDTQKHKQGLYREGDSIQNAQIKMILRKKVVLTVNGRDEILLMDEKKEKPGSAVSASRGEEAYSPLDAEGDTVSVDRTKVDGALKDINQLMSQVRIRPHFKDGQPEGLLLSHIRQNSIFSEMGLQSGDIVKGVNGNEIKSVDDALKFYESLKSSSSVQLQIERQGEEQTITYHID